MAGDNSRMNRRMNMSEINVQPSPIQRTKIQEFEKLRVTHNKSQQQPRRPKFVGQREISVFNDRLDQQTLTELRKHRNQYLKEKDHTAWAEAYKEALFPAWVANPDSLKYMKSSPFVKPNDNPERLIQQYLQVVRDLGDWDWRTELERIQSPALIVYGTADPTPAESAEEWASSLPNGESHVIRDCGRLPWVEKPRDFNGAVRKFLEE